MNEPPDRTYDAEGPARLYRHPQGKIGGVASGLAGYFDIDPVIARLLFVIAALSGLGIPAYILCWIVIPKAPSWPPHGYRGSAVAPLPRRDGHSLVPGFVAILLAALISAGTDGLGELMLPAALVGFGVYLLTRAPQPSAEPMGSSRVDPVTGSDDSTNDDDGLPGERFETETSPGAQGPAGRLRWLLQHRITPTVLSILAFGLALALLAAHFDWFHMSVLAYSLAALAVVTGGLFASRFWGPAPGLLPLAGALSVVALGSLGARHASAQLDWDKVFHDRSEHQGGVGTRRYTPQSLNELSPTYSLGMGELILDLRDVDFGRAHREVSLQLGMGEIEVMVPDDLQVILQGSVGIGEQLQLEASESGVRSGAQLIVDMHLGIGEGRVTRADNRMRTTPPLPPAPPAPPTPPALPSGAAPAPVDLPATP